jgi:hypothetical protein
MSTYLAGHFSLMHGFLYLGVLGLCFLVCALLVWLGGFCADRWHRRHTRPEDNFDPVYRRPR